MEYQDFFYGTGSKVSEEDFEDLIRPVIEDRRDLFPTDEAAIAHYNRFGLNGFLDEFIEAIDELVDHLRDARLTTGVEPTSFLKLVELAVDQI